MNDNGTKKYFAKSDSDYITDVHSRETQSFIDASDVAGKPFFAYVAPKPPHEPAIPAPRHANTFDGEKAPRLPSFNESDMGDKPPSIRSLPVLSQTQIAQIDAHHEKRVESLQSVDELVEAVVNKLQNVGALDNTYVVFTSDNGCHLGEHRIKLGKYEALRGEHPHAAVGPWSRRPSRHYHQQANPKHRLFTDVYGPRGSNDTGVR